jgi:hypothetical protein
MCETENKNRIEEQFISSQEFHRTPAGRGRETTVGEQIEQRTLESFDPVTQDTIGFKYLQEYTLTPTQIDQQQ